MKNKATVHQKDFENSVIKAYNFLRAQGIEKPEAQMLIRKTVEEIIKN